MKDSLLNKIKKNEINKTILLEDYLPIKKNEINVLFSKDKDLNIDIINDIIDSKLKKEYIIHYGDRFFKKNEIMFDYIINEKDLKKEYEHNFGDFLIGRNFILLKIINEGEDLLSLYKDKLMLSEHFKNLESITLFYIVNNESMFEKLNESSCISYKIKNGDLELFKSNCDTLNNLFKKIIKD